MNSNFIEARYGDSASTYLSIEDRNQCEIRQRVMWRALMQITDSNIREPWTYALHSPRALPAFMSAKPGKDNLVWDAGLGTLFDQLSFSLPYSQPRDVIEAIGRRIAAVRCVVQGHTEQGCQQADRASELLSQCPIDLTYKLNVEPEQQFEVYLLTEMQERFALAHELAHYLKSVDEGAFDAVTNRMTDWLALARSGNHDPGALRSHNRSQWREGASESLRMAALDPYAWYLKGLGPDPFSGPAWPTLASIPLS